MTITARFVRADTHRRLTSRGDDRSVPYPQEVPMNKVCLAAMTAALALLGLSASSAAAAPSCDLPVFGPGPDYHPQIKSWDCGPWGTNPVSPPKRGRARVSPGPKARKRGGDPFTATPRTKVIDGVTTRVVEDRL